MKKYIYTLMFILIQGTALSFSGNGSGTEEDPYQITNVNELQEISASFHNRYANYILMNDIDASETITWNVGDHDDNPNTPDSAMGFRPISFGGNLNGNGYVVKDLYINNHTAFNIGLIRNCHMATIENIGIENCDFTGEGTIGGLVGSAVSSSFSQCYTTGKIKIVGKNEKRMSTSGGFCGLNSVSQIRNCYSHCSITSLNEYSDNHVACFSKCTSIYGSYDYYCYATGKVISNKKAIVFCSEEGGHLCFWDVESTGIPDEYILGGKGRTTEEMMKKSTYDSFDFENIWCIDEGNDYPKLRVFGDCPPVGVEDISEIESLNAYVYPNPAKDFINISIKNEIPSSLKIEIYDSMGNKLKKVIDSPYFPAERYKNVIDVSDFRSGVYHIRIQLNNINLTKNFIVIE